MNNLPALLLAPLLALPLSLHADSARHTYRCDNGSQLEISFSADSDGRPQATLHFADGELTLPQVPAIAGTRYRRDPVDLQTSDDDALFTDAQGNRRQCSRALPALSSFIELGGNISYLSHTPLPARAELIILIQAHGKRGSKPLTLNEQRYRVAGNQAPLAFSATVDRDLLGKTARLGISARIDIAGKTHFRGGPLFPSMNNGQPGAIELELQPLVRRK